MRNHAALELRDDTLHRPPILTNESFTLRVLFKLTWAPVELFGSKAGIVLEQPGDLGQHYSQFKREGFRYAFVPQRCINSSQGAYLCEMSLLRRPLRHRGAHKLLWLSGNMIVRLGWPATPWLPRCFIQQQQPQQQQRYDYSSSNNSSSDSHRNISCGSTFIVAISHTAATVALEFKNSSSAALMLGQRSSGAVASMLHSLSMIINSYQYTRFGYVGVESAIQDSWQS